MSISQIWLWCLTIPAPKIMPIIVATIPIANDLDATILLYFEQVLHGLLDRKILVISHACDGTEVERSIQKLLVAKADEKIQHMIKNPCPNCPDTTVTIAVLRGQPIYQVGKIVYLFLFGEFIDAYQNGSISHHERLKLVLQAQYFLDSWETFLSQSGYKKSQYFLSRLPEDDDEISLAGSDGADGESISEAQELQNLIDGKEDINISWTRSQDSQMLTLMFAALAISADEMMNMQSMSQAAADDDDEQIMAEEYQQLCKLQEGLQVPQVQVLDELSKPLGLGGIMIDDLDFTPLVKMRRQHQTHHAVLGVRTRSLEKTDTEDSEISHRQQIICRMREVLKEQSDRAVGTGCEHSAWWGGSDHDAGNAANATATLPFLNQKLVSFLLTRLANIRKQLHNRTLLRL
ncbi:hypothetical protein L208DRAFT_1381678 [Tricholoma matsutake]|nr:hypothetical protein L208DRAFT_1381678 [Tricholoma matsutake 945]